MGMQHDKDDSALVTKMIKAGRDITRLVREAVTADRHSKNLSVGRSGKNTAWTTAAKNRDYAVKLLKKKLSEIAEEL